MIEVITERNKALYFDHFNINEKKFFYKRMLLAFLFFIVYSLLILKSHNAWLIIGVPFVMLLGFKIPYWELVSKKEKQDIIKEYIFPNFLRYFISLLNTQGNVYKTLKATIPYIHEEGFKKELMKLIERLDEKNVNNYEAFMEFSDYIGTSEAHMIIGMIHEFNEEGINKEDIKELENVINNLQENKIKELIEYKVSRLEKHANPILIYGIVYVMIFTLLAQFAYLTDLLN